MKNKILKWSFIILCVLIAFLILKNPSNKLYTEYLRTNRYYLEPYELENFSYPIKPYWGVRNNYLIFSTFKYQLFVTSNERTNNAFDNGVYILTKNHIGILSNFFELNTKKEMLKDSGEVIYDTAAPVPDLSFPSEK